MPTSRDSKQRPLDPIGAVLSMVGLAALLFGIIEGPAKGWTHDTVIAGFVVGAVAIAAFIAWELHTPNPMLQMTVFKNARFTAASLTITLVFFALFGSLFLMTQYWQLVHGYSPLEAGIRLSVRTSIIFKNLFLMHSRHPYSSVMMPIFNAQSIRR